MTDAPVDEILALLEPNEDRLARGRERQAKIWRNEAPDAVPVISGGGAVPEKKSYRHYTLAEQFDDKEKMLVEHLWGMISLARGTSDGQLAIRPNLGVGFIPSLFGMETKFVQEDQMPWIVGHPSKEELAKARMPDVRTAGLMPKCLEMIAYFKEKLDGKAHVYLADTQGPFDIAHLLRGHDIYTDIYDDPDFVHRLLDLTTETYIEVSKVMKKAIGELLDSGYHAAGYMGNGGVRLCDDSAINVSGATYREFIQPYVARALKPFGGGWYHFCGRGHQILDAIIETDGVRGINFGNPEMYDFADVLSRVRAKGKFYQGAIPAQPGETILAYAARISGYLDGDPRSLILQGLPSEKGVTTDEAMEKWRGVWKGN
ncbi:MAG: uroporphyrinogen decarboxylase family protein [Planctomycetota bacterium]